MVDFAEALRKAGEKKNVVEPTKENVIAKPVVTNPLAAALANTGNKTIAGTVAEKPFNPLAAALAQKPATQPQPAQPEEQVSQDLTITEADIALVANVAETGIDETSAPAISAEDFNHPEQADGYLPDDVKLFNEGFDILRSNFEYPDMIGQSIAHCMTMMQEKPHLKEHLREADAKALIEGLRIGYGNAIQIKQTKVTKKSEKAKAASDFAKELDALGGLGNIGDYVP